MEAGRAGRAWCSTCEQDVWLGPDDAARCPTCGKELDIRRLDDPALSGEALLANEQIFRGINDQLRAQAGELGPSELVEFVCECGRLDCDASVYLSDEEYSKVTTHPLWFFCLPGHELPEEAVSQRHERYLILDKSNLAEETS